MSETIHVAVPLAEILTVAQEYFEAGRYGAADRLLGHVLVATPAHAEALHMRGLIALRQGRGAEAAALIERTIATGPVRPVHWRNLSEICRLLGRLDDSLAAARRAVALDPADPLAFFTLGMIHYERLEFDACIAAGRAALDLQPDLPQAHMKLAQALLVTGRFAEGWAEYEWRYRIPGAAPLMPPTTRPQWDGTATDEPLLLVADQGYGDVVQFARYIQWVRARCGNVMIACSREISGLVGRMAPQTPRYHRWEEIPPFTAYCPLSGLPRLHGTTLETIPVGGPYLDADPELAARWRTRLDALAPAGRMRVGLAWAGRPTHNNDANRSVALARLATLAESGPVFVSLQKGPAAAQAGDFPGLIDLDADIASFEDTAAIIAGLDLVLAVDTSVCHIAAAMGRPCWMMLPFAPDWRWLTGREDSPWYPTLRLFRAETPRGWEELAARVGAALATVTRS